MDVITKGAIKIVAIAFLLMLFDTISSEKNEKRIRYISGIILVLYLIQFSLPILKLSAKLNFFPSDDSSTTVNPETEADEAIIHAISSQLCKDIKLLITNRFELPENTFSISVTVEHSSHQQYSLKLVTIKFDPSVYDTNDTNLEVVAKYISDTLAAPCTVLVESLE